MLVEREFNRINECSGRGRANIAAYRKIGGQ